MGNNHHKEKGIKIIDPKNIDYTFTDKDDPFNIKSSRSDGKNIGSSGKSKTERKDIDQLRHNIAKDTKIRTKGRITGGQSKQGHSSVYEYSEINIQMKQRIALARSIKYNNCATYCNQ